MKQQNVLFSGRSLVLFLGLIVQLLLSQTAFAQDAQVPVRKLGSTSLLTSEQVAASYVSPSVALTRVETKIQLHYVAVKSGNGSFEDHYKLDFYQALKSALENGTSVFNSIGLAGNKIQAIYPSNKVGRPALSLLKEEARALLAN